MFEENRKIEIINDNIIIDLVDNYGFSDITYGNDLCRSVGYELALTKDGYNWGMYFQIFLTNSENNNPSEEEFSTYNLLLIDDYSNNIVQTYEDDELNFNTIEDAVSFVISNKNMRLKK